MSAPRVVAKGADLLALRIRDVARDAKVPVLQSLDMLYLYLTTRLTYANLHNDDAALQECVRLLAPVRDAWVTMKSSLKSL